MRRLSVILVFLLGSACAGSVVPKTPRPVQSVYVSGYGGEIVVLDFDSRSGSLTERGRVATGGAPSYMAITRDGTHAYAVDEAGHRILAYAIDPQTGELNELNSIPSKGMGPAHVAVHPSGRWLAVAHYGSGELTIVTIASGGGAGEIISQVLGPNGGCKNAHQAVFDRAGRNVLVPCLGSDYVMQVSFGDGYVSGGAGSSVPVPGGPRHLALDPSERRAYVLSEHASEITAFEFDVATGTLRAPTVVPSHRSQKGKSAHIRVHPNGRWLYASNREENSIGVFALQPGQPPKAASFVTQGLATPRDFAIDSSGRWLLVANQSGAQDVVVFAIDPATGGLNRRGAAAIGGEPVFVGGSGW